MGAAGAALQGAQAAPVTRVEVFPVIYPVTGHFRFFPKPAAPGRVREDHL